MKFAFTVLCVVHCVFAQNYHPKQDNFFNPQNVPQNVVPNTGSHHVAPHTFSGTNHANRRGRWLADPITVDPVYKTVWSPSWSSWPVADPGLYYSAAPVAGHKVVYGSETVVPSWKVAAEPVTSWKVAQYSPSWKVDSWKVAPKEEAWKVEKWSVGDKWDSGKWVADEKMWTSGWSSPSVVSSVPGPSFYSVAPAAWSAPVVKKQQWAYVQTAPKSVPFYGVEHPTSYSAKLKWAKPEEVVYETSSVHGPKPFQYSSTIVHDKPVSVPASY